MTELFKTDRGENMKLKFVMTDVSMNGTPRKTSLWSKTNFLYPLLLCSFDTYGNLIDCTFEIINIHCFPGCYLKRETAHNTQWSRLTDWLGLNLIQDLDRHILEAYRSLCRFPRSKAYMFFLGFASLIGCLSPLNPRWSLSCLSQGISLKLQYLSWLIVIVMLSHPAPFYQILFAE